MKPSDMIRRSGERPKGNWHWTSVLRMAFGFLFLILGVLGLFLPVLQGLLFLAIGIALLADHIPVFARMRNAISRRHPRFGNALRRFQLHRSGKNRGEHKRGDV